LNEQLIKIWTLDWFWIWPTTS